MRRMLLSSLRGAAVWGFRIDGVVHEHQTIPGVVEDVHQIIGNLKTLTLTLDDDVESTVAPHHEERDRRPSRPPTSGRSPASRVLEPRPPSVHAAGRPRHQRRAVREQGPRLRRGRPARRRPRISRSISSASTRSTTRFAARTSRVAETRVGQRTDYDRLTLDGRDQRHDLAGRGGQLRRRAGADALPVLRRLRLALVGADRRRRQSWAATTRRLGAAALDADRRPRAVRSLGQLAQELDIRTLGDLVKRTESQILQVKNFGKKSLQEIADLLERENLNFGMRFEESEDGVRITDRGTPPNRAALAEAAIGDDDE